MFRLKISLPGVLLMITFSLHAQWSADSLTNNVVEDQTSPDEVTPLQATTATGLTYISYFQSSGGSYVLKLQLMDEFGNKLFGQDGLVVSNHPQSSALYVYHLATDNLGNAIVALQDTRNTDLQCVVYKIDQNQNFIWGADGIMLHDALANFEVAPAIGVFSNDDAFIAWNASSGSSKWVSFVKISANGSSVSSITRIKTTGIGYTRPDFLSLSSGLMMTYIRETGTFPGITSIIQVMKYDDNGSALWINPISATTYSISFVAYPVIARDGVDGIFVGFTPGNPLNISLNDAFVQHMDGSGNLLFGTNGVEAAVLTGDHKETVAIAYLASSDQLCVLIKVLDGAQGMAGVYIQRLDNTGAKLLGNNALEILPLSSSNYHEPFGWGDMGDGLIVVYTEGGVVTQKLRSVKVDYDGQDSWNPSVTTLSLVNSNKYDCTVGRRENQQLVVVWYDERIGGGVYAQNISTNGGIGTVPTALPENLASSVEVFPTITHDQLYVACEGLNGSEIQIFSLAGEVVYSQKLPSGTSLISLKDISTGIYFYQLQTETQIQSGKLILQ